MTQSVLIRLPEELVKDIDAQVKLGKYSNRTDFMKDAARQSLRENLGYGALGNFEPWKNKSAAQIMHQLREAEWKKLLKETNNDAKKASELLFSEVKKFAKEKGLE